MSAETLPFDWVISDTHIQHKNINKYCNRTTPMFPRPEDVDNLIYFNWRGLVKPNDRILHLGDVCKWDQGEPIPELKELPGRKFLVKGNHDIYKDEWYEQHGFEIIPPVVFLHQHPKGEMLVHMDHYPKKPLNKGEVSVHGHEHNNPSYSTPSHMNVSVELTHFAPLPLSAVLEKLAWHSTRKAR